MEASAGRSTSTETQAPKELEMSAPMDRDGTHEEQVPQTESEFKSEMGAGSVMGSDTNEGTSTIKSAELIIEPADRSPSNTIARLEQCSVQDDTDHGRMDRGKSGTLLTMNEKDKAAEEMAHEAEMFALYIESWESEWSKTCGSFTDQTVLSSTCFVHYTPGRMPRIRCGSTPDTLQVFSVKLAEITGGLQWPLSVYGVVAARDTVDHNRNLIFSCDRSHAQELKQDDNFLHLIGPSRAIVFEDMLDFEIQLKVKGTTQSEDEALIRHVCSYAGGGYGPGVTIGNCFCKLELCLQRVTRSVQATIVSVQVVKGSWPFEYGGRVACYSLSGEFMPTERGVVRVIDPSSSQIVLQDTKDGAELKGFHGYVHLSRRLVSVEIRGMLDVEIQAYSKSGDTATRGHVRLLPKLCNISQEKCDLDGAEVVVTVAWSLIPTDKRDIMAEGWSGGKVI
ncbi:uncharacterized protein LOC119321435 [Triticum dicoccoides]|uniref:uncharacterized protein LOC119321435 n=1 Tax=Triticum dicoccoides TaxID=85692 RepID=UPI00189161A8|nr:uncharacterized protein LOC119321435 [Triticum dicoccoides]